MIKLDKEAKDELLHLYRTKNIGLEGNILRLFDVSGDEEFMEYINECILNDKETRKLRLAVTKEVQSKNNELNELNLENQRILEELKKQVTETEKAIIEAEQAKVNAQNDLDLLQKRKQTELMSIIVKVALWVIVGVGCITTAIYVFTMLIGKDTQIIGAAWSNMFGILLTNAFSIVGTIMGIKYASKGDC